MKFDNNVFRFWREQKKITLEEVGRIVGASKQTVSKWEKGTVIPRAAKIRAIAKMFDISVYDISDLPPEPDVISRTARLEAALKDPMFDIVIRSWDMLSSGSKGEVIAFIQQKLEDQKNKR